ncbi:MAG: DUF4398 domain-containing protein [Usitatibacter sp.]
MRVCLSILLAASLAGCAFIPKENRRLDEVQAALDEAKADSRIGMLAPAQLRRASELADEARFARDTLDDTAVVDHLAYLAKRHLQIAVEAAKLRAPALP